MTLDHYIKTLGRGGAARLASDLRTSEANVSRWVTGQAKPSSKWVPAIVAATGGKVTVADLRPDLFTPPPAVRAPAAHG